MNSFNVVGNLASDGELKTVGANNTVIYEGALYFRASGKRKEGQPDPVMDFVLFGDTAERFAQAHKKGNKASLTGEIDMEVWEDKNGGGNRRKHKLIAKSFTYLTSKQEQESGEANNVVPMNRDNKPAPSLVVPAGVVDDSSIPF